jgi:CSLREA domain-containing protein
MRTTTLWTRRLFAIFLCLGFLFAVSGPGTHAAAIVVDTTADDDAANGNCTLREAMIAARDNVTRDACVAGVPIDTIAFGIDASTDAGCNAGTGVCTIQPTTELPSLFGSGNITIDGFTQTGAAVATGGTPAEIRIVIDGSLVPLFPNGFQIQSPDNVISGLAINQFSYGVAISGPSATGNSIRGNNIGTDSTGMTALANDGAGVWLSAAGAGNTIGGTVPADRNVISGNGDGVYVTGETSGSTISGNYIGVTADGSTALGNSGSGIHIRGDANLNTIGGSASGAGNIISGNAGDGITINGQTVEFPHDNTIENNWIGIDITGAVAFPNVGSGVQIVNGAYSNVIGPNNVISGNSQYGINIWSAGTNGNGIKGNLIGTDTTGTSAIPNEAFGGGINIQGEAQGTVIGGDTPAERNLISGNTGYGIRVTGSGTDYTVISGNYIGLDLTGTSALLNGLEGVYIVNSAANTTIGGDTIGERNVIVADNAPIKLDAGANNTTVSGNFLGTDITGKVGFATGTGVSISGGAHHNMIGGPTVGERNVISGNGGRGLNIYGLGTDHNQVRSNFIGVDVTGINPLGNPSDGIRIWASAQDNTIGPGNIIANNGSQGIYIYGVDTDRNFITQNSIYAHTNYNIVRPLTPDGSNEDITAPWIDTVNLSPLSVSGTTTPICASCTIEVFTSLVDYPAAGRQYLGTGSTDLSGNWTVSTPGLHGPYISATLTDTAKGTSVFSNRIFTEITALYLPLIMR